MTVTSPLFLQEQLAKLRIELSHILEQLERQINSINQSSAETLVELKKGLRERFEQWQRSLYRAREQIAALPRELGKSDIAKNLRQTLDRCEQEVRSLQLHPLLKDWLERSKLFASRTHLQWGRKIFHTFNGLFAWWLYAYSGLSEFGFRIVILSFVVISVGTEIARRLSPRANEYVCRAMGVLMRERERTGITSATWYIGSMAAVFLVFPRAVFILTLLYVAVGDTAAGIVGTKWGRHKLSSHASLEGSCAAFASCFLVTLLITPHGLGAFHLTGLKLLWFSLAGGLIGTLAEGIFKKLDDNLVIPLLAAPSLWGLTYLFY